MNEAVRRNDLLLYENLTRDDGPAMTWSMHAVGFIELNDMQKAEQLFKKSYETYVREPFNVWTEARAGVGAVNFITGAGGFLQSLLFGYGGLRLKFDQFEFYPQLPPDSKEMVYCGLKYLGSILNLKVNIDQYELHVIELNEENEINYEYAENNGKLTVLLSLYLFVLIALFWPQLHLFISTDHNAGQILSSQHVDSAASHTSVPLSMIRSSQIVNPHDFDYIINPGSSGICSDHNELLLLVYVHSSPANFKRREAIRLTWAQQVLFPNLRVVFMLGATENVEIMQQIKFEHSLYNDIVQENFIDSYKNLTYKGIMALKWISLYCKNVSYILKTDDDIIINMFVVLHHLSLITYEYPQERWRSSVACLLWTHMKVMRDKTSKWYLSKDEYPQDYFSSYCSGSAYFITRDLIDEFYDTSLYVKYFWVDDYYITGLLPRNSRRYVTYHFLNSIYIINVDLVEERFLKQIDQLVFGHMPKSINKIYQLWTLIEKTQIEKRNTMREKYRLKHI
ncbi:unnamed protein product [Didymodactylos carnosus]|uniref:Hexosyltransferase n=1 Tax=Didymodactylos carnosus TaxID=1234261 RepID=A0A8S2EXF6_9BILA|nr:unnamed protein product [Didymodactylos carnosus]CAF4071895.1 unnamed protein product [Didymodactylos carnosus]